MLEILLIIVLTRKIGAMMNDKGYSGVPYQVMFVLMWIGGEIFGAILGVVMSQGQPGAAVYLLALLGAAGGAGLAFLIAAVMPAQDRGRSYLDDERDSRDRRRRRDDEPRRRRVSREEDEYERPRRRPRDDRYQEADDYERPRRRRDEEEDDRPRRRRDDRYREEDDRDRRRFGREEY